MHLLTSFVYSLFYSFIYSHTRSFDKYFVNISVPDSFYKNLLSSTSILDITGWIQRKLLNLQCLQNDPQPKTSCKGKSTGWTPLPVPQKWYSNVSGKEQGRDVQRVIHSGKCLDKDKGLRLAKGSDRWRKEWTWNSRVEKQTLTTAWSDGDVQGGQRWVRGTGRHLCFLRGLESHLSVFLKNSSFKHWHAEASLDYWYFSQLRDENNKLKTRVLSINIFPLSYMFLNH